MERESRELLKLVKKILKLAGFVFISPNKVLKNYTKFEVAVDSAVGSCEVAKIIFSFFSSQILNINLLKEPIKRILQIKEISKMCSNNAHHHLIVLSS